MCICPLRAVFSRVFYYTFWPTSYPEHIGVFYSPSETNVQEKRLTQRKQDLAIAYLETGNATAAYFVAYPNFTGTRETAASNASRVLKEPLVQEFLEKLRAKAAKPTIATMQEVGEFYTTIMRDKKQFVGDRLSAARGVMLYAKQTQIFDNKQADIQAEPTLLAGSFADFCEQAGYFRPFPKQMEMAEFVRHRTQSPVSVRLLECIVPTMVEETFSAVHSFADLQIIMDCAVLIFLKL